MSKSKKQIGERVVVATQILNNEISKARLAGMEVDIDTVYRDNHWVYSAKVYEKAEETVFAQTPAAKK